MVFCSPSFSTVLDFHPSTFAVFFVSAFQHEAVSNAALRIFPKSSLPFPRASAWMAVATSLTETSFPEPRLNTSPRGDFSRIAFRYASTMSSMNT